jgi:hypothetical protein
MVFRHSVALGFESMALAQETTSPEPAFDVDTRNTGGEGRFGWGSVWLWAPFSIAALIVLLYVRTFAVNVECLDEWAFMPYFEYFNAGVLDYGPVTSIEGIDR